MSKAKVSSRNESHEEDQKNEAGFGSQKDPAQNEDMLQKEKKFYLKEEIDVQKEGLQFYSTERTVPKRILRSDFVAYVAVRMDENGSLYADIEAENSRRIDQDFSIDLSQSSENYRSYLITSQLNLENQTSEKVDKMYDIFYEMEQKINWMMNEQLGSLRTSMDTIIEIFNALSNHIQANTSPQNIDSIIQNLEKFDSDLNRMNFQINSNISKKFEALTEN
jgi:hypothetical protein